jgi:ribonuclease HIII
MTLTEKHHGMMALYNRAIIEAFVRKMNVSSKVAIDTFYNSNIYDLYEDEETKLWHLSNVMIANLLHQEVTEGHIDFPEEG